ncbi:hypothetical protein DFH09DRAFT_1079620 [Mycena vulgaris]|nr:hypothetical protein DFH09DRAFT_1079620 [Mycena vulgaris]
MHERERAGDDGSAKQRVQHSLEVVQRAREAHGAVDLRRGRREWGEREGEGAEEGTRIEDEDERDKSTQGQRAGPERGFGGGRFGLAAGARVSARAECAEGRGGCVRRSARRQRERRGRSVSEMGRTAVARCQYHGAGAGCEGDGRGRIVIRGAEGRDGGAGGSSLRRVMNKASVSVQQASRHVCVCPSLVAAAAAARRRGGEDDRRERARGASCGESINWAQRAAWI